MSDSFWNKIIPYALIVCIVLGAAFSLYAAFTYALEPISIGDGDSANFNSEWMAADGAVELPYKTAAHTLTLRRTLPHVLPSSPTICMESGYQEISVRVDGEIIYEYGAAEASHYGTRMGDMWYLIPLSPEYASKDISITLSSDRGVVFNEMLIGSKGAVTFELLYRARFAAVLCVMLAVLGLLCLILALVLQLRRYSYTTASFWYLGAFLCLAMLWIVTDARITQFFTANRAASYFVSVFSFMLLMPAFLLYVREVCGRYKRVLSIFAAAGIVNFMLNLLLFALRVNAFTWTLYITHSLILAATICALIITIAEGIHYKNPSVREIRWAMYALCVMVPAAFGAYYTSGSGANGSGIFHAGMFIFSVLLCINLAKRALWNADAIATTRLYDKMVYIDAPTGVLNRSAFNRDMDALAQGSALWRTAGFVVANVDGMKSVKECYGHLVSDEVIGKFAAMFSDAFDGCGVVYRIGGNAFCAIVKNKKEADIDRALEKLDKRMTEDEKSTAIYGRAFTDERMMSAQMVYDLFAAADAQMYENKSAAKDAQRWQF